MKRPNVTKTLTQLYGTGHFNPRSFDRRSDGSKRRLYVWAIALFLTAVLLATALGIYLFAGTPDSFTGERVTLALEGPTNVRIASDEQYVLRIVNNEEVDLEGAQLFIGYTGAERSDSAPTFQIVKAGDEDVSSNQNTWSLGSINQGQSREFPFVLRFSGQAGQNLAVAFYLNVRPKGFSSDYPVRLEQQFSLGQMALQFVISGPSAVGAGSEVALTVSIEKGEQAVFEKLEDWELSLSYPSNLKEVRTEPEKNESDKWLLRDLSLQDDSYRLVIKGKIDGSLGDKLKIAALLSNPENRSLELRAEKELVIQTTSVRASVSLQPASGKKLQWGEEVNFKVLIENTSNETLTNLTVSVNLRGEDFWRSDSMKIGTFGFFEANNVIWDDKTTSSLASLGSGEMKTLTFSLTTRDGPPSNIGQTPVIAAKAKLRAKLGDEDVLVESEEARSNVLANIEFDALGSWTSGNNPPLPGQDTIFAITWKIGPTSSELKDLSLSAVLPKNVAWKSNTDYSTGELRYSPDTRKVEWRSSKLPKLAEPLSIRFSVSVTPSDEVTNNLIIMPQTTFVAADSLAGETLELYSTAVKLGDINK